MFNLLQDLKPYEGAGFYLDVHYRNVDKLGSTDVCLLIDNFAVHSSLESLHDAGEVLLFAREFRLNGGDLPKEVEQRCDELHKSELTHDNVATFLGLIVEKHVQPLTYSVAKIFEEYAEGEWNDTRFCYSIHVIMYCKPHYCDKGLLFDLAVPLCCFLVSI